MNITPYQAKYFSYQLSKRRASDDAEKLSSALFDAQVDLNPHQIEAALFAFQSPLSKGAILADEVGLGKTIEAGILLSQFWVTDKRKLLIICPSSLRKQWSQELLEKFHLESTILEAKSFNEKFKKGKTNPFDNRKIVICSFHFAKNKAEFIEMINWDLVVIDEAHRLRNVYRPTNKIGKAIKDAIFPAKKVLLTATPLQNSLMELYGLVSIIDENLFGSADSFRSQFNRLDENFDYKEIKDRIAPVVKRTLRRQVQEYIRYTKRIPLTLTFEPSQSEQELYESLSEYLRRDLLVALPSNQRHLLTLIIRKLLASSSHAVTGTLNALINRLQKILDEEAPSYWDQELLEDIDEIEAWMEEVDWEEVDENADKLSLEEVQAVKSELDELKSYRAKAMAIENDSKGIKLLTALKEGFDKLKELGANQKAIIFTESRRTQEYLFSLLQQTDHKGKVIFFNGSNNDEFSKKIYQSWLAKHEGTDKITGSKTADKRQALVDYFRDEAEIMIATEAAAEGINLQFCSMIINYDLPWNPQRVEQRIGRCHRYGQKHDVVVVNFLNEKNAADIRVFELLDQKLNLFNGVFGASDDVLGVLESGVDFEKAIADIYQNCRTTDEINKAFDDLQSKMEESISSGMKKAQERLLENFDAAVADRLKITLKESKATLSKFERWLWLITQLYLGKKAVFDAEHVSFKLLDNPFSFSVKTGRYTLDKKNQEAFYYRLNHPLAKGITKHFRDLELATASLKFDLTNNKSKVSVLEPLKGKKGWLILENVEVNSFEVTDHLAFIGVTEDGSLLSQEQCQRMMELSAHIDGQYGLPVFDLSTEREKIIDGLKIELTNRDSRYLQFEVNKLNKWAEDRIFMAEKELKDIKLRIKELTRQATQSSEPSEQLSIQSKIRELEKKQRVKRREIFDAEDQIIEKRDQMIDEIKKRMSRNFHSQQLFKISWAIV
jgi:ERCC4-related helicase